MKKILVCLIILLSLMMKSYGVKIYIDYYGYHKDYKKEFICDYPFSGFYVKNHETGKVVLSGRMTRKITNDPASGKNTYMGDFSSIEESGLYYIELFEGVQSDPFEISSHPYQEIFLKVLKGLFFQRCGQELERKYASLWNHPVCHENDGIILNPDGSEEGYKEARGGWHDAGDYGKYGNNGAYTLGFLLTAYQAFGDNMQIDATLIPERKNGVPDVLDEAKVELDFLLKCQRPDGAVYHQLRIGGYGSLVMPHLDGATRYLMPVSSVSTADVGAIFAMAARIYKDIYPSWSDTLLQRAHLAWDFLEKNPQGVCYALPPGVESGGYPDSDDQDERFWLACELAVTAQSSPHAEYVKKQYQNVAPFRNHSSWPDPSNFGAASYIMNDFSGKDSLVASYFKDNLKQMADQVKTRCLNDGFMCPLTTSQYYWGSNLFVFDYGFNLSLASLFFPEEDYLDYALNSVHYALGRNVVDKIFVTGSHEKEVKNPHHAQCVSDGIEAPIEGLVVEGPDAVLSDDPILDDYFDSSTPPAQCYIDHSGSWATNEPDINHFTSLLATMAPFVRFPESNSEPVISASTPGVNEWDVKEGDSLTFSFSVDDDQDSLDLYFVYEGDKLEPDFRNGKNAEIQMIIPQDHHGNRYMEAVAVDSFAYTEKKFWVLNVEEVNLPPAVSFVNHDTVLSVGDTLKLETEVEEPDGESWLIYFYLDGKKVRSGLGDYFSTYTFIPDSSHVGMRKFVVKVSDRVNEAFDTLSVRVETSSTAIYETTRLKEELNVYPNPVKGPLNIQFISKMDQDVSIHVFNIKGRIIKERVMKAAAGENEILLDLSSCASGIYFIKAKTLKRDYVEKVMILK